MTFHARPAPKASTAPVRSAQARMPKHSLPANVSFGFGRVSDGDWNTRIAAVGRFREILENDGGAPTDFDGIRSISTVGAMFIAIAASDRPDWYLVSGMLGHPSADLARSICTHIGTMRAACSFTMPDPEGYKASKRFLVDNFVLEMLDSYLAVTVDNAPKVVEEEWAYILRSKHDAKDVHVIATSRHSLEKNLDSINGRARKEAGGYVTHPYGVLAAWLVHDSDEARKVIRSALGDVWNGHGDEYLIRLDEARERVEKALLDDDNTVSSPWHVEDATGSLRAA